MADRSQVKLTCPMPIGDRLTRPSFSRAEPPKVESAEKIRRYPVEVNLVTSFADYLVLTTGI